MFCLDPPLDSIPKGQWFCHTCLFGTGGDYGFDEGEEHSLSSFQARDKEFRRKWFTSHPPPPSASHLDEPAPNKFGDVAVSEYDVEEEFWRLVQSQTETVEIEYGADVHSTTHGSYVNFVTVFVNRHILTDVYEVQCQPWKHIPSTRTPRTLGMSTTSQSSRSRFYGTSSLTSRA
jgi:hypothetical protein